MRALGCIGMRLWMSYQRRVLRSLKIRAFLNLHPAAVKFRFRDAAASSWFCDACFRSFRK